MSFQICFLYTLTAACTCFCITYFRALCRLLRLPIYQSVFSSSCPSWLRCFHLQEEEKKEKERKKPRRPRETAVAAVENVRTRQRKQTGRQLSVFLCEVIMCSPRCFCSHANEVDRVGNHFQTLNRGKSRKGKTKAGTKGCFAVVCVQKWR